MRTLRELQRFAAATVIIAAGVVTSGAVAGETPHKIVSEAVRGAGVILAVRLEQRIAEPDLKALADTLRLRRASIKPPIAAVTYYLPGSALSSAPWASVRYEPDARVAIAGLRREEEDAYRAEAASDQRAIIGVWLTSPPALAGMLTIFSDPDRRTYAEWRLRSGSTTVEEVHQAIGQRGKRFDIAGGGGSYLALWNGALQLGDGQNVIAVAERLTFEKKPASIISTPDAAAENAARLTAKAREQDASAIEARPTAAKRAARRPKPSRQQSAADVLSAALRAN